MRRSRLPLALIVPALAAIVLTALTAAPTRMPRKVAFLVGPSTYLHDFRPLQYAARDVTALADVLREGGFDEVVVLTDPPEGKNPATKDHILAEMNRVLTKNARPELNARRGDVVLVVLSGHGIEMDVADPDNPGQKRRDTFFAPVDGKKTKPETLLSLRHLVDDVLAPCGSRNLLLVDACREVYDPNKGKGIGGKNVSLAGETAILFSCSSTEQSWESDDVKHGVFTYAVLDVLGESRREGRPVTWTGLVAGVETKLLTAEYRKLIPEGFSQTPVLAAREVPATRLLEPKIVERPKPLTGNNTAAQVKTAQAAWAKYLGREVEEEDEIAPGVTMKFVLIPPGTFWMGSPEGEKGRDEDEVQHEVALTHPFYLGKHEVMQAQYEALEGKEKNQSEFKGASLPLQTVSWEEADSYAKEWTRKGSGKRLYRLPTEAEWEYACRGGACLKDSLPFQLKSGPSSSLSHGQINFFSKNPYGDGKAGEPLSSTAPCGSYPEDVNAFGLYDMHGNVAEWCGDWYGEYPTGRVTDPTGPREGSHRVGRGGSWYYGGQSCRAAYRRRSTPSSRGNAAGLRLARVPVR